ncbi:DUF2254 domain-containing protein [Salinarimonas sp.]|uniref:DUF2254 domain-containing protein n=1 Tax=Salinarimonas sp. TaxID=2766526 RepID=UPI00391B5429
MSRLRNITAHLRAQFWIIPGLIVALAGLLAVLLLRRGGDLVIAGEDVWWLYSGDADTARGLLSSFLGGMMTMTSLVVSITFVILTLAANQLGPRLIATFVADREIQAVLGLFLGTILYVVLVLRTLDDDLGAAAVPHIAVSVASLLTILCLFALLFYIHKIARAIIADNVVETVASELRSELAEMLPSASEVDDRPPEPIERRHVRHVGVRCCGYVQVVRYKSLVALAKKHDAIVEVRVRAGHYLLVGGDHVRVHSDEPLTAQIDEAVRHGFVVGSERTPAQDPEFGIRQLVDIGLRALSPSINDPYTAISVVDRLGAVVEGIFAGALQLREIRDEQGILRVVADRSDAQGLVDAAFNSLRRSAVDHPEILIGMADTIRKLAAGVRRADGRAALRDQLEKLAETAELARLGPSDRKAVAARIASARAAYETVDARAEAS